MSKTVAAIDTKVTYTYIPKRIKGITEKNHVLYDGKLDGALTTLHVVRDQSGFRLNLTDAEREFILNGLHLNPKDLNVTDRNNKYLSELTVELPKAGITLDLANPYDLLIDKVLLGYDNLIAPDTKSQKYKATYRYVRSQATDEIDQVLHTSDLRKKAYALLGKLEDSRERMIMYLLNEKVRVHHTITTKMVKKLVNDQVEENYGKFIATLEDPLFTEKGILNMAVVLGVVQEKSNMYFFDNQPLAAKDQVATLVNASLYLKDPTNKTIKLAISKQTLDAFSGTE